MKSTRDRAPRWRGRAKLIGLSIGVGAITAIVVFSVRTDQQRTVNIEFPQAGSGSAAVNTTFTQPVVSPMNVGATTKPTTPGSLPATAAAVPSIKGKPSGNEE